MNRLVAFLGLAAALTFRAHAQTGATPAFPFTYYVHDTTGVIADYPLPSIYQYAGTAVGGSSHIVLKAVNTSSAAAFVNDASVTTLTTSASLDPNFSVTGITLDTAVPVGGSFLFQVNFSPTVTGPIAAYLETSYQVQQSGCSFTSTDVTTQCPSGLNTSATLDGTAAPAFPFIYYLYDPTKTVANYQLLPSSYQFAPTPNGSNSNVVIYGVNASNSPAYVGSLFVTDGVNPAVSSSNFSVTGRILQDTLQVGDNFTFTINFSPAVTGPLFGYLQTTYQVQQNGCSFTDTDAAPCPSGTTEVAMLNGNATPPQLVLSYQNASGFSGPISPSSATVPFGNVLPGAKSVVTFTLTNESTTLTISIPGIALSTVTNSTSPFVLSTPPSGTLAPGASVSFTVTFEPGLSIGYTSWALLVGSNTYPLNGSGLTPPIADISSLSVCYADNTGVQTSATGAAVIPFSLGSGTGANALTLMVVNPPISFNPVSVPAISIIGTAFSLSNFALSTGAVGAGICPIPASTQAAPPPVVIPPGYGLVFTITYAPTVNGASPGLLTIGSSTPTQTFSLAGTSTAPIFSGLSLALTPSGALTSQESPPPAVTVEVTPTVLPVPIIGTITMSFTPSVTGVTDDPAVVFLANNTRVLNLSIASGAQNATYTDQAGNVQSALSFQTGTTAGAITFTVAFPGTPAYAQPYTITPAKMQIASATAVASNPNIVITMTGYDNTYSAGDLSFTFYDASGNAYPPIAYNASGAFQNLFLASTNTAGGAFSLEATFPVTGDISKITSVAVSISNSAGQANQTLTITQ